MQKLLTIVVPVYKVEPYINKCLDSCIIYKTDMSGNLVLDEELMDQLEVIIVNDGTQDMSAEMSREYVKRYPNTFRQIDKENGGHGSAWNSGLKEATGKYLRFLDSDDWLINLDRFLQELKDCTADLVFTQLDKYYVGENKLVRFNVSGERNKVMSISEFPYWENNDISVCDFQYCTYKTQILKPLWPLFDEHVYYDDMILFIVPQMFSKTYIIYDFPLYQYLLGRDGQTMSKDVLMKNIKFLLKEFDYMYSFKQKHSLFYNSAKQWIDNVFERCALIDIIPLLHHMDYPTAYKQSAILRDVLKNCNIALFSKQVARFVKWPFVFYWMFENFRECYAKK